MIVRLNAARRQGRFQPELFREFTGQSVDDLWPTFAAELQRR